PGRGASAATTSSARTGTWSVSVGKTLGNIFRSPFDLALLLSPGRAVPDLEVVVDADDGHLARDPRALDEPARDDQPALPVEVALRGSGEHVAPEQPGVGGQRIQRLDAPPHGVPRGARIGLEAAVEPEGHDDPVLERPAQLGGQGEAVLLVQRVVVFAEQHRSTWPHSNPLSPTCKPRGTSPVPGTEVPGTGF